MLATGQTHPLATKASISIADLRGWPAIFPDESTFTWRLLRSAFPDDYDTFDIQTSTNYLETIAMMVESGLGWSLLPDIMIASKPGLKGQVLEGNTPIRPLGIVTHRQRTPSPAVKVFVSLLKSGEQSIPAP
jgi:DNA-binding transcriptional LysR family regulator